MKKVFFQTQINIVMLLLTSLVFGQQSLKIGDAPTTIDANAVLELQSTTKGLVLPRVATTSAILSPENGLMVYDISTKCVKSYNNGYWSTCLSGGLNQTSNGTAVISSINCASDSAFNGIITVPEVIQGVVQKVTVVVSAVGTYSFSTNTVNGMYFQLSGIFTSLGSQEISLIGFGSPIVAGNFTYTLNSNPGCTFDRIAYYMHPNITLSSPTPYFMVSTDDSDYLPFSLPTAPATFAQNQAADGVAESTFISNMAVIGAISPIYVKIPYVNSDYDAHILPAYSKIFTIPSSSTADGISKDVTFSFDTTTLNPNSSGYIIAKVAIAWVSYNFDIFIKPLDMQTGIGNDYLGVLIKQFTFPYNGIGDTKTFDLRAIAAIPDRNITDINHKMFYLPIVDFVSNNIWLSNNLGADYSNFSKVDVFNPKQQATSTTDFNAYGSLLQWGRNTDGHELMNWTNGSPGTKVNTATSTQSTSATTTNGKFIYTTSNWLTSNNVSLWQGVDGTNNPCPIGYRIPTKAELAQFFVNISMNNSTSYNQTKFSTPGYLINSSGIYSIGSNSIPTGYYWMSDVSGTTSSYKYAINSSSVSASTSVRAQGFSVRCIKD